MLDANFVEEYGEKLFREKLLNSQKDIHLVLLSGEAVIHSKSLQSNDFSSHISFFDKVVEYIYSDEYTLIMYVSCTNTKDLKNYFKTYWFFFYTLTGIEAACKIDMVNVNKNGVVSLQGINAVSKIDAPSIFFSRLRRSRLIGTAGLLSRSIYNQDVSAWKFGINPLEDV